MQRYNCSDSDDNQQYQKIIQANETIQQGIQPQILKSCYRQQYLKAFKINKFVSLQNLAQKYKQELKIHKIIFHPQKLYQWPFVQAKNATKNSQIITLLLGISYFSLQISILNLEYNFNQVDNLECLGDGSYGFIYKVEVGGFMYACKNILFKSQSIFNETQAQTIYNVVVEYAYCKICSAFKIGLSLSQPVVFDLICFTDCVQFYMEIGTRPTQISNKIEQDMLQNLSILHQLKIIHSDIKPANILYSECFKKYVFIDFGVSQTISASIGERSRMSFKGSYGYSGPQMRLLFNDKMVGFVDLYYNDLCCLLKSFKDIKTQAKSIKLHQVSTEITWSQVRTRIYSYQFFIDFILVVADLYFFCGRMGKYISAVIRKDNNLSMLFLEIIHVLKEIQPNPYIFDFYIRIIRTYLNDDDRCYLYQEQCYMNQVQINQIKYVKYETRFQILLFGKYNDFTSLLKTKNIEYFSKRFNHDNVSEQLSRHFTLYITVIKMNQQRIKSQVINFVYEKIFKLQTQLDLTLIQQQFKLNIIIEPQNLCHLNNLKQHFIILCLICQKLSVKKVLNETQISNIWYVLDQFILFNYINRVLTIYKILKEQKYSYDFSQRLFFYTFKIILILRRGYNEQSLAQLLIKTNELKQIHKQMMKSNLKNITKLQTNTQLNKINQFYEFVIEICQFIYNFQENYLLSTHEKHLKISFLNLQMKFISIKQKYQKDNNLKKLDNKYCDGLINIISLQINFLICYKKQFYFDAQLLGQQLIRQYYTLKISNQLNSKQTLRFLCNIMAFVLLQIGFYVKAGYFFYKDLYNIPKNQFLQFQTELFKTKYFLNIYDEQKAKVQMQICKNLSEKYHFQQFFISTLIVDYQVHSTRRKYKNNLSLILLQIEEYEKKFIVNNDQIRSNKINCDLNYFYLQKMLEQNDQTQLTVKNRLLKYRQSGRKITMEPVKNQKLQQQILEWQHKIDQCPPQNLQKYYYQKFYFISAKFHQIYSTRQICIKFYQTSKRLYHFKNSSQSLKLWFFYYYYVIKKFHNSQFTPYQKLAQKQLQQMLSFVFQINFVYFFINFAFVYVISAYQFKFDRDYSLTLFMIKKHASYVKLNQFKVNYLDFYYNCYMYFKDKRITLFHLNKLGKILIEQKFLDIQQNCVFLYFFVKKRLQFTKFDQINLDLIMKLIILSLKSSVYCSSQLRIGFYEILSNLYKQLCMKKQNKTEIQHNYFNKIVEESKTLQKKQKYFKRKHFKSHGSLVFLKDVNYLFSKKATNSEDNTFYFKIYQKFEKYYQVKTS